MASTSRQCAVAEPLYKIGPGDGQWLTIMQLLHKLGDWHNLPPGTGSPSMTISKDTREPASTAVKCTCRHTTLAHATDGCVADTSRDGLPDLCGCRIRPTS